MTGTAPSAAVLGSQRATLLLKELQESDLSYHPLIF
jgi:hypothetical protein